ncbi:MAG: FkbM family methyltransferase, partial [Methylocella sp.]
SAQSYRKKFAGSKIYCFEPVEKTFQQLRRTVQGYDNIFSFKLALSAARGTGKMVLEGDSEMFFLLNTYRNGQVNGGARLEEVKLETVDEFCAEHRIDSISLLKIDTEGGDFDVLMGADGMLSRHKIDVVQVEAGMNRENKRHVPFDNFSKFFEQRHYFLFGIYEQVNEWPAKEPHLRRTNPVFISDRVIKANIGR